MSEMPSGDPYIENILAEVPEDTARTLTTEQWEGIREALRRARDNPRHFLDVRFILPLYFIRLYCIFVFGRDARERVSHLLIERRKRTMAVIGAIILSVVFVALIALALSALYIIKTLAGIDLFEDVHLRDWML